VSNPYPPLRVIWLIHLAYDDLIILPIPENLNQGKTFSVLEWAAEHARVPSCTFTRTSNSGWSAECAGERAPDYVFKADMDTFLVLPELERRMRIMPRSKLYWGRECPLFVRVGARTDGCRHEARA
jgi:hypothetical protein